LIHFFKQKPFLRDFITDDYVDIHSHLLPGIDDGATTIEDTTKLIKGLQHLGFKKFITTPHVMGGVWNNTKIDIEQKLNNTIADLTIPTINERCKAAAEYMIDAEFRDLFSKEKLLTLRDNYVLVEMSYLSPPMQLFPILHELQNAGYQPVLAHPERYNFYHHNVQEYQRLKDIGCFFQLNILSATGYYGPNVAKITDYLLENNLFDFAGSDVHHTRHVEYISKRVVLKNHKYLTHIFQNNSFFDF